MPAVDVPPTPAPPITATAVTPSTAFFGQTPVRIRFTPQTALPAAAVEVVGDRDGRIARRIAIPAAAAGAPQRVDWDGTRASGAPARDGRYRVRLVVPGTALRRSLGAFVLRGRMYPIRGAHHERAGLGRFGAPRSGGRIHEGYDVWAGCGTPLSAARGGTVVRVGYDPVLYGNEVVIRGRGDRWTYRYSHLRDPALVQRGDTVRTGQRIGRVGLTGNARTVGCQLHIELRSRAGALMDPGPLLRAWDRVS